MFLKDGKKLLTLICLAAVVLFFPTCSKDDDPQVTADEGVYINEIYASSGEDWMELYNTTDAAIDLSGYKVYDDETNKYVLPNGTSIGAKGFLVLLCNDLGTGLNTNFKLSSDGETLFLENKNGELLDMVEYPALQDGQSYGRFADGTDNWLISGSTTQGAANGDTGAPAILDVTRTPLVPDLDDNVVVKAELVSDIGVASVKLFYSVNGGAFNQVTMTAGGGGYNGTIPALNATGKIDYYVQVTNTTSQSSTAPFDAPDDTYSYLLNTDPLPQLVINEFLAFNSSCCPDNSSGADEFDDWIEIYNAGATAVDIGGMYVSDNKANPFNSKIPKTNATATTIQPGGFLVVWADNSKSQGELHVDFALSNDGEDVGLYYIDGRKIDEYTFGAQSENVSWGRSTNGGGTWKSFAAPTKGTSNQ